MNDLFDHKPTDQTVKIDLYGPMPSHTCESELQATGRVLFTNSEGNTSWKSWTAVYDEDFGWSVYGGIDKKDANGAVYDALKLRTNNKYNK